MLNTLPARKLAIKLTLTNGKTFPDGLDHVIFNCDSHTVPGDVVGGGLTADVTISKNNDLLNCNAHITIFGIDKEWQKGLYKLQQMTGIGLYENYVQIYAGYNSNAQGLSSLIYQGQLESVQPDKNGGLDATVIVSRGIFEGKFNATANPVVVNTAERLTSLFDRIINQALNPVDATTIKRVYKLSNPNVLCAKNESFNQSNAIEQLSMACYHNNCYPPNFNNNVITIISKDYDQVLQRSDDQIELTLDENNIIGYPRPGQGAMQRIVVIRYSDTALVNLLQKIYIVGDYDDIDTQQPWFIDSLDYHLQSRGEKWEVTLGLGTYAYNILNSNNPSNNPNPATANPTLLQNVAGETDFKTFGSDDNHASIEQRLGNHPIAPIASIQAASTNLGNLLNYAIQNAKKSINTGFPAKILSVDNETNRYTIQSLFQVLNYNGTLQQPLIVHNAPAFCPKFMQIAFEEGDIVRVQCDQYYTADIYGHKYTLQPQRSPRRLSSSDCVIMDYAQDLNDKDNVTQYTNKSMKAKFKEEISLQVGENTLVTIKENSVTITQDGASVKLDGSGIGLKYGLAELQLKEDGFIELGSMTNIKVMANPEYTALNQINISGLGEGAISAFTAVLTKFVEP